MAYILFTLIILTIVAGTALYLTRNTWVPTVRDAAARVQLPRLQIPGRDYLYSRLPSTFAGDAEAGLSSASFDLTGNVEDGDGRAGLDDDAKQKILRIMKKRRLPFDEARRTYMELRFSANGIGADGRPKDPKFVSFS